MILHIELSSYFHVPVKSFPNLIIWIVGGYLKPTTANHLLPRPRTKISQNKKYTKLAFKKSLASLVHPFWNMQTSTSCPTMVLWYLHKMTTLIQPVRKLQDFMILMKPFEKMFLTKVPPAQLYQTSQDLIQPRSTNSDRASMFASFFSNGIWIHMTPSKAKKNDFE